MAPAAQDDSRRIYMIGGVGSVGKLIAHSLRELPDPPPITHLLHTYGLIKQWEGSKKVITLQQDGKETETSGYAVELMHEHRDGKHQLPADGQGHDAVSDTPIQNLLVITKAAYTVPNLIRVAHRLGPDSTVCFMQNGMGIVDEVNQKIFPDIKTRPNYMQAVITHGMNTPPEIMARDPFYAVHGGKGTITLALLPRESLSQEEVKEEAANPEALHAEKWPSTARYLLETITKSPLLAAHGVTATDLLLQQLTKVVVNSVVNPITTLVDGPNGTLLNNDAMTATMRLLISESGNIIRNLPEVQGVPDLDERLGDQKLEAAVRHQCEVTPHNISSMLSDIRIGQQTEIEYINGYIVRRGEELRMKAVSNYTLMQIVIAKSQLAEAEKRKGKL